MYFTFNSEDCIVWLRTRAHLALVKVFSPRSRTGLQSEGATADQSTQLVAFICEPFNGGEQGQTMHHLLMRVFNC